MKLHLRRSFTHIGTFSALLCLLWLGLAVSAVIPNDALYRRFSQSALSYGKAEPFQFHNGDRWNAIADNYADSILLNVAWNMGNGAPLTAVIDTDYYDGEAQGENVGLYLTVTEGRAPNTDYTRYWHGSVMFLRPLHLVMSVSAIRMLGFSVFLLLLVLTAILLARSRHGDIALLLLLSLAAVQVWNIRLSMEYQPAFLLTFLLCPLYLLLERRGDRWLTLLSTAGGTAIAFFDFLTTETLTLLIPLLLVLAVRAKEGRLASGRDTLLLLLRCGLAWCCAYAGCFLVKWIAASIVTGENAFALALSAVAERTGSASSLEYDAPTSIFSAITANLTMVFGGTARVQLPRVLTGLAGTLGLLLSCWYLFRRKPVCRGAALPLFLTGAVVFLRYLVLNNHSYLHEFFTYRALAAPILALLLVLRLNTGLPKKRGRR